MANARYDKANLGLHGMNYAINVANSAASRRLKVNRRPAQEGRDRWSRPHRQLCPPGPFGKHTRSPTRAIGDGFLRALQAELELGRQRTEQLELEVSRQNETIEVLNQSVVGLESENRVFEEKTERLKDALGNNTALLNKSLCE